MEKATDLGLRITQQRAGNIPSDRFDAQTCEVLVRFVVERWRARWI
jgi:hypothetical protein